MSNVYQLLDNPLLTSGGLATESEIRSRAAPIFTRLSAYQEFAPITATALSDWSIQAGDIIKISTADGEKRLPVYMQKITWNGGARAVYQSTGSEKRPVQNIQIRKQASTDRDIYSLKSSVGGLGGRTAALEDDMSYAYLMIDEANAQIALKAGQTQVDDLTSRVSQVEIDLDGANAQIALKAGQTQVDQLTTRISQAEIDLEGANARIDLKASQTTVDALGTRVSQAEIDIDGANSEITLKADKVYVDSQITTVKRLIADEIDAAIADLDLSISESIVTSYITVTGRATLKALALDGSNVSKTTLPVVTRFTQASGETAATTNYTLLTTSVGTETEHDVANGETISFAA